MYAITMLLILLIAAIIPFLVCGVAGVIVGWIIGMLMRSQRGQLTILGGLFGCVLGGILYLVFKHSMLDSYLHSIYNLTPSYQPNEIYGHEMVWTISTPHLIMIGTMMLVGALTGAIGVVIVLMISKQSPQVPPKPGPNCSD